MAKSVSRLNCLRPCGQAARFHEPLARSGMQPRRITRRPDRPSTGRAPCSSGKLKGLCESGSGSRLPPWARDCAHSFMLSDQRSSGASRNHSCHSSVGSSCTAGKLACGPREIKMQNVFTASPTAQEFPDVQCFIPPASPCASGGRPMSAARWAYGPPAGHPGFGY